jgi:hypothetical protein
MRSISASSPDGPVRPDQAEEAAPARQAAPFPVSAAGGFPGVRRRSRNIDRRHRGSVGTGSAKAQRMGCSLKKTMMTFRLRCLLLGTQILD